jgi:hypothetical protein
MPFSPRALVSSSLLFSLVSVSGCHKNTLMGASCPETVLQTTEQTTTMTMTSTQVSNQSAFDINNVSVLEATDHLVGGADAVILDHDLTQVPANATWRVSSVDVLVMVSVFDFPGYPQSVGENQVALTVQVWDANSPLTHPPFEVRQVLAPSALSWNTVTLSTGVYRSAWWRFDFAAPTNPVIPATGMKAPQYLVGVKWENSPEPQVGYSNFNRPCDRNWTNATGSSWVLNSTQGTGGNMCNWPMMRVNSELLTQVTTTTTTTVPVTVPVTVLVQRDQCDPTSTETMTVLDGGVDAGLP